MDTHHYRKSRIIRSSFSNRFRDTIAVFFNLLDYPLLGLPSIFFKLQIIPLLGLVFSIAFNVINLAKFLVASILVLAVLPIVAVVHAWYSSVKNSLTKLAEHLKIIPLDLFGQPGKEKELKDSYWSSEDFMAMPVYKNKHEKNADWKFCNNSSASYSSSEFDITLALCRVQNVKSSLLVPERVDIGSKPEVKALIKNIPENKKPMQAILQANMFWATSVLAETKLIERMEEEFGIRPEF